MANKVFYALAVCGLLAVAFDVFARAVLQASVRAPDSDTSGSAGSGMSYKRWPVGRIVNTGPYDLPWQRCGIAQ